MVSESPLPPHLQHYAAPAKLNLFLQITGRRADGYHLLQTLFQLLDYGDRLAFQERDDGQIVRRTGPGSIRAEDDIVVRAARLLQQKTSTKMGADIYLEKRLPVGGGLGGGSSDAATTLCVLNDRWECGLNKHQLADLGVSLGADVPVFVYGKTAWAEGIGEKLTPVELKPAIFVVIRPPVAVSTAAVFSSPQLTRDCHPITIADFLSTGAENGLQSVVCEAYPEVGKALEWLAQYAPARLTGTGSCVFAEVHSVEQADLILAALPARYSGFCARGVENTPLFEGIYD